MEQSYRWSISMVINYYLKTSPLPFHSSNPAKIMDKKTSLFELNPKRLGKLLSVCSGTQTNDKNIPEDQKKAELLQDRLSETLMSGSLKKSSLRKEVVDLCTMAGIVSSEPIKNLLANPQTDIELFKKIKRHGKSLSEKSSSEIEHETANVIYYAAIAAALVIHDKKITQFSYKDLRKAYSFFIQTAWISNDLKKLFEKVIEYCNLRGNK